MLFFLCYCQLSVVASTWQVVTEAKGLCGRSVNCLAVYKNIMAVGTEQGVSVYNGDTCIWSALKLPEEIASLSVCDMAIDEYGHYWLASNRGLVNVQGEHTYVYDASQNLPTVDINRVQITGQQIFAGCFGGYIASAFIPQSGMTRFSPVNYKTDSDMGAFKIRSVGVSALAMQAAGQGWVSTMGGGMVEISGVSEYLVKDCVGQPESWVNDFFIFYEGKSREARTVAVTPEYLSLIKNNQSLLQIRLPVEEQWLTSVITTRERKDYYDWVALPKMEGDAEFLNDFIKQRCLYVGTRSSGLWRFYKGKWSQYLSENSMLPSNCINRLYVYKRLLLVCTDAGLVMIHLDPDHDDEFKFAGVGTPYNKTFFPFRTAMIYKQVVKGSSYWISHQYGLTRWKTDDKNRLELPEPKKKDAVNLSIRMEAIAGLDDESGDDEEKAEETDTKVILNFDHGLKPSEDEAGSYWQHFTNERDFEGASNTFPIQSQNITSMVVDGSTDYLWLVFDNLHLVRMRMVKRIIKNAGKNVIAERPDWQPLEKYVPWSDGERLNVVWYNAGKIYVGTSNGFYILANPASEDMKKAPFDWVHYGVFEGLPIAEVRGFAFWNSPSGKVLTIMHNQSISTWDGQFFSRIDLGGTNTCIRSGQEGNLWIGTTSGLYRIDPLGNMYLYNRNNADFESDVITAIGVLPYEEGKLGVWVACDGFVKYTEKGQGGDGSDKMPSIMTRPDGTTVTYDDYSISDIRFNSTSFHFYDGLTWEKWRVAGIRDIFIDRNYIWTTSNIRVRRMRITHQDY